MLTKRQKQILNYITKFIKKNDYAPSLEEIKEHFKLSSVSTIHQHVEAIREKGFLNKIENHPRSIEINNKRKESGLIAIPLLGTIAAGQPIEAIEDPEIIEVPKNQLSKSGKYYALKVRGNSMIDERICDNDIVIIKKQQTAENGEVVVALINGNEATLKKLYKERNGFRLQPANPRLKPIFTRELLVQGKVISILRNLENQLVSTPIKENEYIFSDEYINEKQIKELTDRLIKFREKNLANYVINVKDKTYREEILDSAILQSLFLYLTKQHGLEIKNQAIQKILEELQINGIQFKSNEKSELEDILGNYNLKDAKGDILGFVYQSIHPQTDRKEAGQYYTPNKVVDFIIGNINIDLKENKNLKVLDPACGSGQFLLRIYDKLFNQYQKLGLNPTQTHKNIIEHHLIGIDIDPIACALTKANLLLRYPQNTNIKFNIYNNDYLKKDYGLIEPDPFQKIYKEIDFIIGNPPWGAKLSKEQKKYFEKHYEIGKVGLNPFTLFIERCFNFLKDGAKLGFLIPEAYLKIKVHQPSRMQILNKARILLFAITGEIFKKVYAPSLILICQTEKDKRKRDLNKIIVENGIFNGNIEKKEILQKNFYRSTENIFNINQIRRVEKILDHILNQKKYYLKNNALFILGIVTGDNKKYLIPEKKDDESLPIIIGKDVAKYKINFSNHYFIYDKNILQQVAPKEYYTVPEKIIYKFIGAKLTFAHDNQQYFTLNNANAFVPRIEKLKTKYILALLNSKVLQFFYSKSFFTVKVLKGNLEKLPLVYATPKKQDEIIKLVDESINSGTEEIKSKIDEIDEKIFDLYRIEKGWKNYIISEIS